MIIQIIIIKNIIVQIIKRGFSKSRISMAFGQVYLQNNKICFASNCGKARILKYQTELSVQSCVFPLDKLETIVFQMHSNEQGKLESKEVDKRNYMIYYNLCINIITF
ncbi:hypothetical protein pb186bvf_016238 [Paramecium bursaria]